ncbi:MAG: porin family protein [Nitrospirota bacterium]|nr:porin family protein [Nitrospirota bacterium]
MALHETGSRWLALGILALGLLAVPGAGHAQGAGLTGNINLFLGGKTLDEADWYPVEKHGEIGLVADIGNPQSLASLEVRLLSSSSDTVLDLGTLSIYELTTSELDLGGRFTFVNMSNMRPYLAGGLAMVTAEPSVNGFTVSDSGTGVWLAGGIYWIIGHSLNLGFDYMVSHANVTIVGVNADAGGGHFNFLVGLHF